MKKIKSVILLVILLYMLIIIGKIAIEILKKISFWDRIDKKYFATIVKGRDNEKIIVYNKTKKLYEFSAQGALAILSVENGNLFYLKNEVSYKKNSEGIIIENSRKEKNFIVEYDIRNKRILKKKLVNISFNGQIPYIKKIKDQLFFSRGSYLDSTDKSQKNILYEYNIKTEKTKEVLKYNGQGLPIIKENEIIYSKENRIYIFDRTKNKSEYLFEGELPFDYLNNKVYYMNGNNIVKRYKGEKKSELIYKVHDNIQIGGYPLRIDDELFMIIELKEIPLDKTYAEYCKLKIINVKNKMKLDIYKIYYKKEIEYPLLTNNMFIITDELF